MGQFILNVVLNNVFCVLAVALGFQFVASGRALYRLALGGRQNYLCGYSNYVALLEASHRDAHGFIDLRADVYGNCSHQRVEQRADLLEVLPEVQRRTSPDSRKRDVPLFDVAKPITRKSIFDGTALRKLKHRATRFRQFCPRDHRKTTPTVLSKKGCSNRPHAKRATRPPGLSTRSISVKAVSMSAKNMIPKRQVTRSTLELEKGI